jgi:hypothetical protein
MLMMFRCLFCLALLILTGCSSEKTPRTFKFTFHPPDSVSFVVELAMARKTTQGDQTSTDSTWTLTFHSQTAEANGYSLNGRTDSVVLFHDGQPINDPVIRLFAGGDVTLVVDSTGMATDVLGYDELMSHLDEMVGPDTAAAVRAIVTPEKLRAQELSTWNMKFASFIDREMELGKAYPDTAYPMFPVEGRLASYGVTELVDTVTIGGRLCGKLRVVSSTDPAELARLSDRSESEISLLFGLTDNTVAQAAQRQAGHMSLREWVLEFETMLSHSESSREEVHFAELSGSGLPTRSALAETKTKKFSYPAAVTP